MFWISLYAGHSIADKSRCGLSKAQVMKRSISGVDFCSRGVFGSKSFFGFSRRANDREVVQATSSDEGPHSFLNGIEGVGRVGRAEHAHLALGSEALVDVPTVVCSAHCVGCILGFICSGECEVLVHGSDE